MKKQDRNINISVKNTNSEVIRDFPFDINNLWKDKKKWNIYDQYNKNYNNLEKMYRL